MADLSILIPARNEPYLSRTIKDLQNKAIGDIEIIAILDGENAERVEGVKYVYHPEAIGMKYAINSGVEVATGKYLMKIDAHCIVAPGFDEQLIKDHQDNWIQVPRRYRLDEDKWEPVFDDPPIDYEYWIWPFKFPFPSLHGFRWWDRGTARRDAKIDEILTFQGSFWFMTRSWWDKNDFMHDEGYNELHAQEATYLGNTTWNAGGKVMVNKNTWYSHLHKRKGTRGYHLDRDKQKKCYEYSYKHWVMDNKDQFIKLIEKFWPIPNWPSNWKEQLYGKEV